MRLLLAWFALFVVSTSAHAQSTDTFALTDRDRATIGIVVAKIYNRLVSNDVDQQKIERGTGVIVSGDGHVLTAGHVLNGDIGKICRGQNDAPPEMACNLTFYWKGDERNGFALEVISGENAAADYVLLRLPRASDKINAPIWPSATLAENIADNETLIMAGYTGSNPIAAGSANQLELTGGRILNGGASSCTTGDGWGSAREMDGKSAEGWSGGAVLNQSHRLAGIVLGRGCTGTQAAGGGVFDKEYSRILPIGGMIGLCSVNGFTCNFGMLGDLNLPGPGLPIMWRDRLVGGAAAGSSFVYGWRVDELAHAATVEELCRLAPGEARHLDRMRGDLEAGVQLAVFFDALVQFCRFGPAGFSGSASSKQLVEKANQGLDPALVLAAQAALDSVFRKRPASRFVPKSWNLTTDEMKTVAQAEMWLIRASDQGWQGAKFLMFEGCRVRLFACNGQAPATLLSAASQSGQPDALREESIYLLAGAAGDDQMRKRTGFSLPHDFERSVEQLQRAAQPRYGSNEFSGLAIWDPRASAYLAFFNGGGTYQGRTIMPIDTIKFTTYLNQCLGGGFIQMGNVLHDFCGFSMNLNQFNNPIPGSDRQKAWQILTSYVPLQPDYFPIAQNLLSWSNDGNGIKRIDCPLAIDMTFTAPLTRPELKANTAYCYFKKGDFSR